MILQGGEQQAWDLAAFNAALAAGAVGGALTGGVAYASPSAAAIGASPIAAVPGSVGGATAIGAAAYAGFQSAANAMGGGSSYGTGESPPTPDVVAANDPNQAAQFQRTRKAARALGRAGTFKFKGANSSLGLGDQMLGDQLALIGS